jgi:hypothetical protein
MSWFARMKRRFRNYTSSGDYAGAQGGRSDGGRGPRNANAQAETIAYRPDRSGSGGTIS